MTEFELNDPLAAGVDRAWERFVDQIEPLRPDLFRFGLHLAHNPFDAEDLVHDAMLRAFMTIGRGRSQIRHPRAFLFRTLTNLWIDELRRAGRFDAGAAVEEREAPRAPQPGALHEAADRIFDLPARERAAVVLKEAFDMSHAQIAEVFDTTVGAAKVALHRGRQRLEREQRGPGRPARVSPELLDRFVEAIRAHDVAGVCALVSDELEAVVFPEAPVVGDAKLHERAGWIRGALYRHVPGREATGSAFPYRLEIRELDGERVVLAFVDDGSSEALEEVWLIEEAGGRIARIRDYCFCPDLVRWVADHFGLPARSLGYRIGPDTFQDVPDGPGVER